MAILSAFRKRLKTNQILKGDVSIISDISFYGYRPALSSNYFAKAHLQTITFNCLMKILFQWKQMYFLIYCLFILFNTSSISTLSWYFNTKCRLFFRLNIVLFRGSHSLKFFPGRFGHLFPFQMIGRRFLHMSCQPVGFRKTSHSLLTVIINDFLPD